MREVERAAIFLFRCGDKEIKVNREQRPFFRNDIEKNGIGETEPAERPVSHRSGARNDNFFALLDYVFEHIEISLITLGLEEIGSFRQYIWRNENGLQGFDCSHQAIIIRRCEPSCPTMLFDLIPINGSDNEKHEQICVDKRFGGAHRSGFKSRARDWSWI